MRAAPQLFCPAQERCADLLEALSLAPRIALVEIDQSELPAAQSPHRGCQQLCGPRGTHAKRTAEPAGRNHQDRDVDPRFLNQSPYMVLKRQPLSLLETGG